ncbi:DUF2812 domain-containing protein [Psychrobacillus sp. NPDC096389]|uniref:DUF2812 domain-containing protein n=1 Tax=Psychrobacillus sp. NPDC096389 TaxID=3364490 RepID=UPI0037F6D42D
MKKVKNRLYLDYEKEEQWINDMVQEGWHLKKFMFFRFTFEKGEQGSYIYRNEFLGGRTVEEENNYIEFLKESDIEVVYKFGGWAYFRRKASKGPFEIYTDTSSKVSYFNRILSVFIALFLVNLMFGIINLAISQAAPYLSVVSFIAAIVILIPIVIILRRKKALQEQQNLFEQ